MDDNIIGEVSFKFNSRFSQLIGRNLISNPIVAVSELVKNAYDADANNINVEFKNILSDTSILTITDDGEGMSFNDIATKWMMVGTDNKVHTPFTTKGRRKLGEKGIGRFSVERLAKKMILTSTKKGDDFSISFLIDWDTYETYNGEFSELKHKVIKNPCDVNLQGTYAGDELFGGESHHENRAPQPFLHIRNHQSQTGHRHNGDRPRNQRHAFGIEEAEIGHHPSRILDCDDTSPPVRRDQSHQHQRDEQRPMPRMRFAPFDIGQGKIGRLNGCRWMLGNVDLFDHAVDDFRHLVALRLCHTRSVVLRLSHRCHDTSSIPSRRSNRTAGMQKACRQARLSSSLTIVWSG